MVICCPRSARGHLEHAGLARFESWVLHQRKAKKMKIHLIIARHPSSESPWIVDAWDEHSIDFNPDGYNEAFEDAAEKNEVREAIVEVPDSLFDDVFEPLSVKGEVK